MDYNKAFTELNDRELMEVEGGVAVMTVLGAMGTIYGAVEACKWAWNHGQDLGDRYLRWRNSR